jgi:hypothetical protein
MAEQVFLSVMQRLGFTICEPRPGMLWEFEHPDTGERRYVMRAGEVYSVAIERLREELAAGREWGGGTV